MISCRNVSRLLTSGELQSQAWWTRMEVHLHLVMCGLYSRLARQLEQLRAGARNTRHQNEADPDLEARVIQHLTRR